MLIAFGLLWLVLYQVSCTTTPELQPQRNQVNSTVKLVDNRVVFSDEKAFLSTLQELGSKSTVQLNAWEKDLSFTSLRSKWIMNSEDTELPNSLKSFGFPDQLASVINQDGEYQIGNEISWFHNGYRYVAASEQELQKIKLNPDASVKKYEAGSHVAKKLDSRARINYVGSNSGRLAYYQKEIYYTGSSGAIRKFVYEIYVYTQEQSTDISGTKKYYTSLYLPIKLEYRSGNTYRPAGERRTISYNVTFNGTFSDPWFYGTKPTFTNLNFSGSNITQSSDLQITLGSATVYYPSQSTAGNVQWDVNVDGNISSYMTDDTVPSNAYPVSGYPLW